MSGGHFNYINDTACHEIFGWSVSADYGEHEAESKIARRLDPLEDAIISELVFDVFCILHSYDWYACADTCEDTYREDVRRFKDKWLKPMRGKRAKEIVDDELNAVREKLYRAFSVKEDEE